MVDVGINTEEALEHVLHNLLKVLWERNADLGGEDRFVVQLALDPCHQKVNVLGGGKLDGLLELDAVGPQVLVPGGGREQ